ncbi:hypothetical protein BHYA_0017g00290 [Botrytis hyacinthi]|uniref:Uncharacterized protein n=1 Tax=Botrytis hyacinthi TaxID=278943 RepID=A0A4Z1H0M5_9HELO|nr:hypothetical protein BHYA_0017g00290 [Botrytis hyacinthi]
MKFESKMAPRPSPLSASFSDSEGDHPQRQEREDLSPELIKSLKQACQSLERHMIEEEEKRMWAAVVAGKSIEARKRWRGRSPAESERPEKPIKI